MSLAAAIASLRERIQGAAVELSWIPALQKDTRSRNGHASTAIEGNPLTLEQVSKHVAAWLDRSVTRVLQPDHDHITRVLDLLHGIQAASPNLVTDAQVAAIAMAHKATVHTADRDFMRFKGLECVFPLES